MQDSDQITYFTVADSRFFLGLVAMINSLRLTGNKGRIVVLDLGLSPSQKRIIAAHAEILKPPAQVSDNPLLSKPFPYLSSPEGLVVVIDSDIIVTGSLHEVMEAADGGAICLFSDEIQDQRWFPEWENAFSLAAPLRKGRSLNSGFVALSTRHWPHLLRRWWEACERIQVKDTRAYGASYYQPFWDGDQDALNALLMSEIPEGAVRTWPQYVAPLLKKIEVRDEKTLACTYQGGPALLLHYTGGPKPWLPQGWMRVEQDSYVRLLPRLLCAPDVEVRMHPRDLPLWLRPGPGGRLALFALTLLNRSARYVVARTSGPLRERLMRLRARIARPRMT